MVSITRRLGFCDKKKSKKLEIRGVEPRASRMRSGRSTTELHPLTPAGSRRSQGLRCIRSESPRGTKRTTTAKTYFQKKRKKELILTKKACWLRGLRMDHSHATVAPPDIAETSFMYKLCVTCSNCTPVSPNAQSSPNFQNVKLEET